MHLDNLPIEWQPPVLAFLEIAPVIACQALYIAPISTMIKIRSAQTTSKLPPLPYFAMVGIGYLWIGYGIAVNMDMSIITANLTAVLFGLVYIHQFTKHNSGIYTLRRYFWGLGFICLLVTVLVSALSPHQAQVTLGTISIFVSVAFFGGPLSAVKDVVQTSSTKNLPLPSAIATAINCVLWIAYGVLVTNDPFVYVPNILGLAAGVVQLLLFVRYGVQQSVDDPPLTKAAKKLRNTPLVACL
jgi:solute carrier family 50 protein (sugar transporter)